MLHKTLFISDLHLDENHPKIAERFLHLLKPDRTLDAIYILGDFFEAWIGDDDQTPFHQKIIQALHTATQRGLKIYFLCGNRDFLIGERFLKQSGCVALKEEEKINLYGTPVLLMHGDTLCTQDKKYLKMRKWFHNKWVQKLFLSLPLSIRRKIADKMRASSQHHTQMASKEMMDVTQTEVENVMQQHQVHFLIHGHTHQPAVYTFEKNNAPYTRIVLGAWHDKGNFLIWDETNKKEWTEF